MEEDELHELYRNTHIPIAPNPIIKSPVPPPAASSMITPSAVQQSRAKLFKDCKPMALEALSSDRKEKANLKVRIAEAKEEVKEEEEDEEEDEEEGEGDAKEEVDRNRKRGRQKKQKWTENAQARRERNRKSARESRLRKKNFVSNLEDKVKELEAEVKRQRIIIENQNNMSKITKYSQIESMHQLLHGRQIQYEKLHFLLENKCSYDDIENQIEALNIRHGSFGKDRKILLNTFFKNIIDNILPNYAKYLMYAAEHAEIKEEDRVEKLKKFSKYQLNELMESERLDEWEEILGILNTTAEQRRQIMDQKKNLLLARIEFKNIVHSLIDKKKQIFAQSANLEKIMDEFRNVLNPEQVGKFLVWLETKNKNNLNAFDLWGIKRIQGNKIKIPNESNEMITIDENFKIPKSGKTKRKRSCKRKNKNLKIMMNGVDGEDEQIFNDGDGLIDSDIDMEQDNDEDSPDSLAINLE